jgi:hypothetical protein
MRTAFRDCAGPPAYPWSTASEAVGQSQPRRAGNLAKFRTTQSFEQHDGEHRPRFAVQPARHACAWRISNRRVCQAGACTGGIAGHLAACGTAGTLSTRLGGSRRGHDPVPSASNPASKENGGSAIFGIRARA